MIDVVGGLGALHQSSNAGQEVALQVAGTRADGYRQTIDQAITRAVAANDSLARSLDLTRFDET